MVRTFHRLDREADLYDLPPEEISEFPWYQEGAKQKTLVRLGVTCEALYVHATCYDKHSSASCLNYGDSVYLDSCFEWFLAPAQNDYMNIEVNCIGTAYVAIGTGDVEGRHLIPEEDLTGLSIKTSLPKAIKKPLPEDRVFTIEIKVTLAWLEKMFGEGYSLEAFRGNMYRCGGLVDPQYGSMAPIHWPYPNYHLPAFFEPYFLQDKCPSPS